MIYDIANDNSRTPLHDGTDGGDHETVDLLRIVAEGRGVLANDVLIFVKELDVLAEDGTERERAQLIGKHHRRKTARKVDIHTPYPSWSSHRPRPKGGSQCFSFFRLTRELLGSVFEGSHSEGTCCVGRALWRLSLPLFSRLYMHGGKRSRRLLRRLSHACAIRRIRDRPPCPYLILFAPLLCLCYTPARNSLHEHVQDQKYGLGIGNRSPNAIIAFVDQHGKQMYRLG